MYKLFITAAIFFCSCKSSLFKENNIRGIKVTEVVPNLSPEAKLSGYYTFSVELYYSKYGHLYHLNYRFDSIDNDVHILSEDRDHYVYYRPGSTYGYDFNVHESPNIRKISMDSLRKREWVFRIDVYNIFTKATTTLISSKKDRRTGTLHESYNFKGIQDTSMTGYCHLKFTSKLKDIEYSLCRELDSAKKMKLQEIRIVNNPRYFKAAGLQLEKAESSYKLEEIKNLNSAQIMSYFKMLEKESQQ